MDKKAMDTYKDFIFNIRKFECDSPYIIAIHEYPPRYLKGYVKMILEVPYSDGACHAYYGDLKKIIYSFISFYMVCISHVCKKAEMYSYNLKSTDMMRLMDRTIDIHDHNQEEFINEFEPVETEADQEKYDTIVKQYKIFREKLLQFKRFLNNLGHKQEKVDAFTKDHFKIGVEKVSQMCDYCHIVIGKLLADRFYKIRTSIEDSLHRIRNNVLSFNGTYESHLSGLYNEMYDLNKERLFVSRQSRKCTEDSAEIEKNISKIRSRIETFGNYETFNRLEVENEHWSRRLAELDEAGAVIMKLKNAINKIAAEQQSYAKFKTLELVGAKTACWQVMGENYAAYRKELEKEYDEACRALITFFSCRGTDRVLYTDNAGSYFVDEYGHQNYITHYGAKYFHVNCEGEFIENLECEKYFFDEYGRYVLQDGKKIYQVAPCTSRYQLIDTGVLEKLDICPCTQGVCSALKRLESCRFEIKDLTDVELLPKTEEMNIEKTLDADTVKYLWDSFGWLLPEVLYEVTTAKPKNPIHYFGHLLLNKKYDMTEKEIKAKKKEAQKYRDKKLRERKENAAATTRAWKAKQAKPVKLEDLDTTTAYVAYSYYQNELQNAAQYYNDDAF